jgi:predicted RNA-binding protein associated with RNAse of E/G family
MTFDFRKLVKSCGPTAMLLLAIAPINNLLYAQDLESVKQRLGESLKAGELSPDEAELMLNVLRRARQTSDKEAIERRLGDIKADLKAAVEAGKISAEDAEKKLNAVRQELLGSMQKPERKEADKKNLDKEAIERRLADIKADLKAAVEAGQISAEDAEKKLNTARQEMLSSMQKPERKEADKKILDKEAIERRLGDIKTDLKAAVEAGQISAEDAEKKLNAVRQEMLGSMQKPERKEADKRNLDKEAIERRLADIKADLKAAVEAGQISAEDAEKKLNAVRQELLGSMQKPERKDADKKILDKEAIERRLGDIKADLKAAVEAGQISAEDAESKLNNARRELIESAQQSERKK